MEGSDDDFDLLLELADEIEEGGARDRGPSLPHDYAAFIPASDGEESEEELEVEGDPLEALAKEAEIQEPTPKRPKPSAPGMIELWLL